MMTKKEKTNLYKCLAILGISVFYYLWKCTNFFEVTITSKNASSGKEYKRIKDIITGDVKYENDYK